MSADNNEPSIHLVAGARPNFMKIAPLYHALKAANWGRPLLVHTGQHRGEKMSDPFWRELRLPVPDIALETSSGTHAEQTASVMLSYERFCLGSPPDWVIVVGDVNSTLACTLAAKKLNLPVAHLEAGLRSGDRTMPEEINRICTDAISDLLWTPSLDANQNLLREGVEPERIDMVGNIMIDSLEMLRPEIERRAAQNRNSSVQRYGVVTLHRPSNVDDEQRLRAIVENLLKASHAIPLIFPIHPRTRTRLGAFQLDRQLLSAANFKCLEPLSYIDFMALVWNASLVITDSGGIQEETTYLGIPCVTLRSTTERPITLTQGTNRLAQPESLADAVAHSLQSDGRSPRRPELWDGRTAGRVVESLRHSIEHASSAR